jgi:hypothetical protein
LRKNVANDRMYAIIFLILKVIIMISSSLGIPSIAQLLQAINNPQPVNFNVGTTNMEAASTGSASAGSVSTAGDCASCGGSFSASA